MNSVRGGAVGRSSGAYQPVADAFSKVLLISSLQLLYCYLISHAYHQMCLEIFLGSAKELPTIPWDEENPRFYLSNLKVTQQSSIIKDVLKSNHLFKVGSHMGCACGFCIAEELEDRQQRIKDVTDLLAFLSTHLPENTLKLFCTSWENFPDVYHEIIFSVTTPLLAEFYFEEDVVLLVTD
jgi:hypothetical protein